MNLRDIKIPVAICFLWILLSEVQIATTSTSNLVKLDVTGLSCAEIYDNRFPLEKSLDNIPSTFYHAKTNVDGWAKYSIPKSTVRLVKLQNRHSCCADRMTNNVVYVCRTESDDTCQECGKVTDSIGLSQWASITCNGLRGQMVKVQATNSYLQIAQIEVYADPELTESDLTQQLVSESSSSTNYDLSRFALEKSLDNNPSTFFHARSNTDGWAKYSIPESTVRLVRLQNRHSCCEDRMTNNVVFVCTDTTDGTCQECGRVTDSIGRSQWAEITCGGDGLTGSIVKVAATDSYLQIAQIEVFIDKVLVQLKLRGGTSSANYDLSRFALEKSWDNDKNTFFHAKSTTVGWAKYRIPEANVRKVRLQNRHSCCADRMTNNVVFVCTDVTDATCQECGRVTDSIGLSEWAEITCSGYGLTGSIVKVAATDSYLQIAQIEIFADRIVPKNVIQLEVTEADSSYNYDLNRFALSKSLDNDPSTFFHAGSNVDGWAKYNIPASNVRYVKLQNRHNCCTDRMTNNKVYVCGDTNDATCTQCGEVTDSIGASQWATVTCPDGGLYGSIVKVQATNSYLQIAQIEVYGDEQ